MRNKKEIKEMKDGLLLALENTLKISEPLPFHLHMVPIFYIRSIISILEWVLGNEVRTTIETPEIKNDR